MHYQQTIIWYQLFRLWCTSRHQVPSVSCARKTSLAWPHERKLLPQFGSQSCSKLYSAVTAGETSIAHIETWEWGRVWWKNPIRSIALEFSATYLQTDYQDSGVR